MRFPISIIILILVQYEMLCVESVMKTPILYPHESAIPHHRGRKVILSHFSLSPNTSVINDYMNSSAVTTTYNYGFEVGYLEDRTYFEDIGNSGVNIWQYGVMIGVTYFGSSIEEENANTIFKNDNQGRLYQTHRSLIHTAGFLTLRPTASIQFPFLPKNLLLVSGIKVGYRFSEFYQDYLISNDRTISDYLPNYSLQYKKNDVRYVVRKDNDTQNYLYGSQLGITYQFGRSSTDVSFFYNPTIDLWLGVEYMRANLLGNGVQDYFFYGMNFRFISDF
jgi:hypothetical protein